MLTFEQRPEIRRMRNSSCFSDINLERLRQIMSCKELNAGVKVFPDGDEADSLVFLHSGKVKLTKLSEDGKEFIMGLFHAGDFFGPFDDIRDSNSCFTAKTTENCVVGVIRRSDLENLLWQHGELAVDFMKWMGYMHRLTQTKLRDLLTQGKPGALCSTLIRLSNTYGVEEGNGTRITLKLTHTELADCIGCARESVNRMLGSLRKAGAIAMQDGIITILNFPYLRQACQCEMCPVELCRI
jgi:CRP/FNR family transcriptional regulator